MRTSASAFCQKYGFGHTLSYNDTTERQNAGLIFLNFVSEDDLSPNDSQDVPDEGSDQTVKILYESVDNGNYIDISNFSNGELILGSKGGENFTYLVNIEETNKLNNGKVAVAVASDNPQNIVHIEFLSKYMCRF